jgi:hypothetical protein
MWRKRAPEGDSKIAKRLSRLPEADLVAWADQAIYSTGRYLTAYQRERLPEYLEEARSGAEALLEVVDEIRRRQAP